MAASSSQSSLPQGFSVYQPAPGAQLQFFPALGTQQLDDMIGAYVPGPAAIKDKRATISLDFLQYAQTTGQTFKFYPVSPAASMAESPVNASPSLDSANSSSFNVSPATSSWDWSATASVSSRSSTQRRRHSKATAVTPSSRHRTNDFSNLPGMKILTTDGRDVTNAAARGSKTKEQRDHAHLMRIIKACDSCRRKKIRCDPSHKKRGASQAQPQTSGSSRKPKIQEAQPTPPQPQHESQSSAPPPEAAVDELASFLTSSFDLDPTLSLFGPESLDASATAPPRDLWDDLIQFPPMDATQDYEFFLDQESHLSSGSFASSSSASPFKAPSPQWQQEPGAPPGPDATGLDGLHTRSPQYPFLDQPGSAGDYTDFNLFSPESSFSEDDRMLSIGSSSSSLLNTNLLPLSECSPPGYDVLDGDGTACVWQDAAAGAKPPQFNAAGDIVAGTNHYHDSRLLASGSSSQVGSSNMTSIARPESLRSQGIMNCPPGTVLLAAEATLGDILNNVSTTLDTSGSSPRAGVASNEFLATRASQSVTDTPNAVSVRHYSEYPAARDSALAIPASYHDHEQPLVSAINQGISRMQPASARSEAAAPMGAETGGVHGSNAGREPVSESHVAPVNRSASHPIFELEKHAVGPFGREPPDQPDSSRGGGSPASVTPLGVPRVVAQSSSAADAFGSVVARLHVENRLSSRQGRDTTASSTTFPAHQDVAGPGVYTAVVDSSWSSANLVSDMSTDMSCLQTVAAGLGQEAETRQTWSKSTPAWETAAGAAASILSALVLSMCGLLTCACWAYLLGAVLTLASASATATTLRYKPSSTAPEGEPSCVSHEVTCSSLYRQSRRLAAAMQRHISRAIAWTSVRAFSCCDAAAGLHLITNCFVAAAK